MQDLKDAKTGEVIVEKGERVTAKMLPAIKKLNKAAIFVYPFVSEEVEYLSADAEDKFVIAQANTPLDEFNEFDVEQISCRHHSDFRYLNLGLHQLTWMWLRTRLWVSALR